MPARKKKPEVVLNWHPNYRLAGELPDIKQVRTGFLVNFAAIFLAVVALAWTLKTEMDIYHANHDIDLATRQIEENKKTNSTDLSLSSNFVNKSKGLQFTSRFINHNIPPLELLASLTESRPDSILFDSVEIIPVTIEFEKNKRVNTQNVIIAGTFTSESSELGLNDFVEKILATPVLKNRAADPTRYCKIETKRDVPGIFKFTITITLKPTP